AISSSDRELTDRSWPPTGGQPLPARSGTLMEMNVRPQSAVLKMIRQSYPSVWMSYQPQGRFVSYLPIRPVQFAASRHHTCQSFYFPSCSSVGGEKSSGGA